MKYKVILLIIALMTNGKIFSQSSQPEICGVDISYLAQQEKSGVTFQKNNKEVPVLQILNEAGVNWIRLRLWHSPRDNWNNLENTLITAQKIKKYGFKFLLDIHYSDTWADPSNQTIPKSWENHDFSELCTAFETYTSEVISEFNAVKCPPDMIQIGNEITNGMLWPHGKTDNPQGVQNFGILLKKASSVIRSLSPQTKIMLHIDRGDDVSLSNWFFNIIKNHNVDYDVIGLSYYPYWNGKDLSKIGKNINNLKKRFNKDICIVETSYMWTVKWNDNCNNIAGTSSQLISKYPATPDGQKQYLSDLCNIVTTSGGIGIFWWEPTAVSTPNFPSALENTTWFDFKCNYNGTGDVFSQFK